MSLILSANLIFFIDKLKSVYILSLNNKSEFLNIFIFSYDSVRGNASSNLFSDLPANPSKI